MVYEENPKEFTKRLQNLVSEPNEVAGHEANVQNSYRCNNHEEFEILSNEGILFQWH